MHERMTERGRKKVKMERKRKHVEEEEEEEENEEVGERRNIRKRTGRGKERKQ